MKRIFNIKIYLYISFLKYTCNIEKIIFIEKFSIDLYHIYLYIIYRLLSTNTFEIFLESDCYSLLVCKGKRHKGQTWLVRSQVRIQVWWNAWLHGILWHSSLTFISSKQIEQHSFSVTTLHFCNDVWTASSDAGIIPKYWIGAASAAGSMPNSNRNSSTKEWRSSLNIIKAGK